MLKLVDVKLKNNVLYGSLISRKPVFYIKRSGLKEPVSFKPLRNYLSCRIFGNFFG